MKKKIFGIVLALVMVLGVLPGFSLTANAAGKTSSPVLKENTAVQETLDALNFTFEFQSSDWYPSEGTTYKIYFDYEKTTEAGTVVLTADTKLDVTLNTAPTHDTRYFITATAPNLDESNPKSIIICDYRIAKSMEFSYGDYTGISYIDFIQDDVAYDIVLPTGTASDAPISIAIATDNGATVVYGGDTNLQNGQGTVSATVTSADTALSYSYTVNFTTMNLNGSGTKTDPWLITNATELAQLADCLNSGGAAPMDAENYGAGNFYGYYFKLTADIDLNGVEWDAIGHSGSTYFAGNFDGGGHTVSNLNCVGTKTFNHDDYTHDASFYSVGGLFGWCAFNEVSNVTVKNANIVAIGEESMSYAGGIMAVPYACKVTNCHVIDSEIESGRVPSTNSNFVGGVAGMAASAMFEKCSSVNNTVRGTMYVGGFIGSQEGESTYTDCYVANTTGESVMVSSSFDCNVGGFASASQDGNYVMTNCFVYDCKTQVADGANANQYKEGVLNKYEWSSDIAETTNCYYYTTQTYEDGTAATAVAKTTEEFANGTVLASLNGDRIGENAVWMQGETYPVFIIPTYTVTVTATPTEGGTVTGGGTYEENTSVTVAATANTGYKFVKWTENGSDVSTDAEYTFLAAEDRAFTAEFKAIEYVTVNLESPRGLKDTVTIDNESTVADLKAAVAAKCNVTFGTGSEYRLFGEDLQYPNSSLSDDTKVLKDIGFASNQTIHLEKSTNWDASGEPIKIFGLTITGGKGSQEPYGDYTNVDYYWNYYYKTIIIKSTAGITISGTGEPNTNIIIKKPSGGGYTNLTISDLSLTTDAGACINVQGNSWVKLTVKGNNTLTATGEAAQYTVDKMPALTLTNSGAYLIINRNSTGTLTASTNIAGQPGIGTYDDTSTVWGIVINGGTIIANGGEDAAGIRAQVICISGGNVTANGGITAYGTNSLYDHLEIKGGTVVATSDTKALSTVPILTEYVYYTATASTNKDGTDAVAYDSAANDTYKYFKIVPRDAYTVKFDANGGEGTMADQIIDTDVETALAENQFTRAGYTFAGWATAADGTVVYADKGNVENIAATGNSITLYAKWTANTYTVKFDANGGNGTMADQTFTYDVSQNLSANAFTYANKHFNGWNTAADGSGTAYADGQSVGNLTADANGIVTLYALWSDKTPQDITFDTTTRSATYGDGTLAARPAAAAGAVTYSSSDETVATVDGSGVVTVLKAGTTTITASAAETAEYAANSASYTLTIAPKPISGATVSGFDSMTYTGQAQTPVAAVTLDGFGEITGTWSTVTNVADTATFTASGNFTGTIANQVTGMEKVWLDVTADTKCIEVGENIPEPTYTITGFVNGEDASVLTGEPVLTYSETPSTSGTGTYSIEIARGTLTAANYDFQFVSGELYVLEHVHDFTGAVSLGTTNSANDTILVTCNAAGCPDNGTVKIILVAPENAVYEPGLWYTASLYGDEQIDLDSDDIVCNANPVNAGTYTASITYGGQTASVTYTVAPAPISGMTVNVAGTCTYDGTEKKPAVTVTIPDDDEDTPDTELILDADYTVGYSNNINAGENTAVVTVTGKGNYTGTATANFSIGKDDQSAPDGLGKTDESIKGKNDGTITGVTSEMEYATSENGSYTAITGTALNGLAGGTYYVRYAADANYNASPAVSLTVAEGAAITVTYNNNDREAGGMPEQQTGLSYGDKLTKPADPTAENTDFAFAGWYKDAACTTAWDFTSDTLTENVTLYAKWKQVYFAVTATIKDHAGSVYHGNVEVKLMRGSKVMGTVTGTNGSFTFPKHVEAGMYNLVAVYTDNAGEHTKTELITVDHDEEYVLQLPEPGVNSHLEVSSNADTPAVMAGGLDAEAEEVKKKAVEAAPNGETIKEISVTMAVEGKQETQVDDEVVQKIEEAITGSSGTEVSAVVEYLEIEVKKEVVTDSGTTTTEITETSGIIEIVVPFNFSGRKEVKVIRHHGSEAAELEMLNNKPEQDQLTDKKYWLDMENGYIHIYTQKFSTYAVSYTTSYTVTFDANGGVVNGEGSAETASNGTVTLPATDPTRSGYTFQGWYTAASGGTKVTDSTVFKADSTVYAQWSQDYVPRTYKVTVEDAEGGTVKANRTYASSGTTVTLTVTVEDGCEMDALTVTDSRGNEVKLTDKGNGKYTFRMPSRKVTVTAQFHRCPSIDMTDVPRDSWYHEAVDYVLERGLMDPASETAFDYSGTATRAVLVAALWRNEGSPVVDYLMTYSDLEQEHENAEAIRWATSVGIVNGFPDGTFCADEAITREQMAAIFYRYEQYKGEGFEGEWTYELPYADADQVGGWAYEAVCWNTLNGIVQGDGTNFDPKGTAERAHVAQLLKNYLEN